MPSNRATNEQRTRAKAVDTAAPHTSGQAAASHAHSPPDVALDLSQGVRSIQQRLQTSLGNRGLRQLLGGVRDRAGEGTRLPASLQAEAEARFGADFSGVRVHDNSTAHALAQQHLARAFTLGSDIVFNRDYYQPGSPDGRQLLHHELAHVVQQTRAGTSAPGQLHEAAADRAALAFRHGTGPIDPGPAAALSLQRTPLSREEIAQLDLTQLRARLAANEAEAAPFVQSPETEAALGAENIALKNRLSQLLRNSGAAPTAPDPAAETEQLIETELTEVTSAVAALPARSEAQVLNAVRAVAVRIEQDRKVVAELVARGGSVSRKTQDALTRLQALNATSVTLLLGADKWHTNHPAGQSLGMWNEEAGTNLVIKANSNWEKGSRAWGALQYTGAFGVATLDAAETLLSFGYHDAATAVGQAYAAGAISWDEGNQILRKAAWRALLTAAITRGVGAGASRLGVLAARGVGLAPQALSFGLVAGGVSGGLSTAVALGTQKGLTSLQENSFKNPVALGIWMQGAPKVGDWAWSMPLGIFLGALGGASAVRTANAELVGKVIQTPNGPLRVVAVKNGAVILQPLTASAVPPPPPPLSDISLVYDATTKSWRVPPDGAADGVSVPRPAPSGSGTGSALAPRAPALAGVRPQLALPAGARVLLLGPGMGTPASWLPSAEFNALPPEALPPVGAIAKNARWVRSNGAWLLEVPRGSGEGTRLLTYGTGSGASFIVEMPGQSRTAVVTPRTGGTYQGGRKYPMLPKAMIDPTSGLQGARSHLIPHADGDALSTNQATNFVAHMSDVYNERVRRTLEQRFRDRGHRWVAYNIFDATPRFTVDGHVIPAGECLIEIGPNGPIRAWNFPNDPALYQSLPKDIDVAFRRFEVPAGQIPSTPVLKGPTP